MPGNGTCGNASAFSQQFINSDKRFSVRCGPQSEAPVTSRPAGQSSSLAVPAAPATPSVGTVPGARMVPRHVYEQRQNTANVQVAAGYAPVWEDGRLNPRRAERTASPSVIRATGQAPTGYKPAWDDDRLNGQRSVATPSGETQTDRIWTQTVPRTLVPVPIPPDRPVVVFSSRNAADTKSAPKPAVTPPRVSTRSATPSRARPVSAGNPRYVRVATYASDASARAAAQNLARGGLPIRLGSLKRGGKTYRVVLAGPFAASTQAEAALTQVRNAGFGKARISK